MPTTLCFRSSGAQRDFAVLKKEEEGIRQLARSFPTVPIPILICSQLCIAVLKLEIQNPGEVTALARICICLFAF